MQLRGCRRAEVEDVSRERTLDEREEPILRVRDGVDLGEDTGEDGQRLLVFLRLDILEAVGEPERAERLVAQPAHLQNRRLALEKVGMVTRIDTIERSAEIVGESVREGRRVRDPRIARRALPKRVDGFAKDLDPLGLARRDPTPRVLAPRRWIVVERGGSVPVRVRELRQRHEFFHGA